MEVYLTYADVPAEPSRRQLHKLGVDVPFYDTRPPPGVETISIHSTILDICIQRSSARKQRRRTQQSKADVAGTADDPVICDRFAMDDEELLEIDGEDFRDFSPNSSRGASQEAAGCCSELEYEGSDQDDILMLLEGNECDTSMSESRKLENPSVLKRVSSNSSLQPIKAGIETHAILNMVDAAIRGAISGTPTRLPKGISIKRGESFRALAAIAPSLWSPGYLPAIASRAVFLPTISHAIRSVCNVNTRSNGLKARVQDLGNHVYKRSPRYSMHKTSPANAKAPFILPSSQLSAQIWRTMQRELYNWDAARRLKSFSVSVHDCTGDTALPEGMNDDSQWCCDLTSLQDIEECEEYLLDSDLESEDSICDEDNLFDAIDGLSGHTIMDEEDELVSEADLEEQCCDASDGAGLDWHCDIYGQELQRWEQDVETGAVSEETGVHTFAAVEGLLVRQSDLIPTNLNTAVHGELDELLSIDGDRVAH